METADSSAQADSGSGRNAAGGGTNAWWWLAFVLSLLPLAAITSTLAADGWRFCEDIAGQVGEQAVVQACRPISATDLVPVVLPIAVLLFPQIAELTIPGVISLKQRVARQEEEQRRLHQDVVRVQQQVSQRVINVMNIDVDEFWKKAAQFVREDGP